MRTFKDYDTGIVILHNGDCSGDARIVRPDGAEFEVPCRVLVAFAHGAAVDQIIGLLEQLPPPPRGSR